MGLVKTANGIGGVGAGTGDSDADLGCSGIAISSMGCRHLVAAVNYLDLAISVNGIKNRHVVNADDTEDMVCTQFLKHTDNGVCTDHRKCFLQADGTVDFRRFWAFT